MFNLLKRANFNPLLSLTRKALSFGVLGQYFIIPDINGKIKPVGMTIYWFKKWVYYSV